MANETADNTILAVRIPSDLRARIKAAADREDRTESSFARFYLSRAADAAIQAATGEAPDAT